MTTGSVAEPAAGDSDANTEPDEASTAASASAGGAADVAAGAGGCPELMPTDAARELLVAYKTGDDPAPWLAALAEFDEAALRPLQTDRDTALAFWLNCYNAGTQRLLDERPALYESPLRMVRFFGARCLTVAGTGLSLDDIEQGILRGRSKYGLGYLPRLLPDTFEVLYGLDDLDPRIHFALNCGAASCPAIRAYDPDAVDDQLDRATRAYLDSTVEYDPDAGRVRVPRVFLWYRGDFGGAAGIRDFLREYDVIPPGASPSVRHRSWDWSRAGGTFVE
ncbi:MAG: DUF547 domain-containing protein [Haloarculaceae archaeon]